MYAILVVLTCLVRSATSWILPSVSTRVKVQSGSLGWITIQQNSVDRVGWQWPLRSLEEDENDDKNSADDDESLGEPGVVMDDLDWRVEKLRLEEQNKERFLKAPARFLPYEECCRWVQAFGRWKTEQDWKEWIEMGEKRNAYIPSRPDEYYGRLGQWVSWEAFLVGVDDPRSP